jgi:predicted nuclease of predicted toxin-antitoxin system
VSDCVLLSSDSFIFDWARQREFAAVITADRDFVELVERLGPPPKVIRISGCDFPSRILAKLLRREAIRLRKFLKSTRSALTLD